MSSSRSASASSPADKRTNQSPMPSSARASGLRRECVVVAGWVTRLFESPRLFEMSTSRSASMKAEAALLVAGDIESDQAAALRHLPPRQFVLGMARQAGIEHPG